MKRSPLPRRTKPIARTGRKTAREADQLALFRVALAARGWCDALGLTDPDGRPVCGSTYGHRGVHAHHVAPSDRDRGIHNPDRGRWLCGRAHEWTHAHPSDAERLGLLARSEGN